MSKPSIVQVLNFAHMLSDLVDWEQVEAIARGDDLMRAYIVMCESIEEIEKANPGIAGKCGYEQLIAHKAN